MQEPLAPGPAPRVVVPLREARLADADPGADLSAVGLDDAGWIRAAVPGDVRSALVAAGRIPDPNRSVDDAASAWVDRREWWYRFALDAVPDLAPDERLRLVFDGIDTFATLYLDGAPVLRHRNMFRPAVLDVGEVLSRPGPHVAAVVIHDPLGQVPASRAEGALASLDGPRVRMRKAQFGFGWDFGPNRPSLGLWRGVRLERQRRAALESVRFRTLRIDDAGGATVSIELSVDEFAGAPSYASIALTGPDGVEVLRRDVEVRDGRAELVARIERAWLWWPHGLGEPARYRLAVSLEAGGERVDTWEQEVGIRRIALDESPDADEPGTRFFRFVVNGRPCFAKGANWIPCDTAVGAVPASHVEQLLAAARDANMNMIRVWGGGVYEEDAFYDACDRLGLLVWQEFAFACAAYSDEDPALLDEIEREARYQVRRLQRHPCLALWSGNNEVEVVVAMLGGPGPMPGRRIFYDLLPRAVAEEDGVTGYIPSSPTMGNGPEQGDRHAWEVWHGLSMADADAREGPEDVADWIARTGVGQRFDPDSPAGRAHAQSRSPRQYLDDLGRFSSEFGLIAPPARATLARFVEPAQLALGDPAFEQRNRDMLGPTNKLELVVSLEAGRIADLDDAIDLGQLAQAEGLKLGVEHYRRRWPHCGGALIWQYDDCWPGISWSLVDYLGRPKGAWYYARRFFAPVLASFHARGDGAVELWGTNDAPEPLADRWTVRLAGLDGAVRWERELPVELAPGASRRLALWEKQAIRPAPDLVLSVRSESGRAPANRCFFAPIKDLARGPAQVTHRLGRDAAGRTTVTLRAEGYALFVHVVADPPGLRFDDNYVDLAPGETRTLTALGAAPPEPSAIELRWR